MNKYYNELLNMMNKNEKEIQRLLIINYTNALGEIKKTLKDYMIRYSDLSYSQWLQYNRLKSLEMQINKVLNDLYKINNRDIKNHSFKTYEENYFGLFYELESKYKINLSFSMISEDYVRKAIEYPVGGLKLSERLYSKHLHDLKIKTKACLIDHMINDRGYKVMAKKLSEISNADYKQSLRIAITEGNRLRSLARQDSYEEATYLGIDLKKKWLSTLDNKTRCLHRALDGQVKGINEEFEISGYTALEPRLFGVASMDIHCRCDTINVVEGISPTVRRDNETKKIIPYKNYDKWFENRVQAEQTKI
ncbi:phage minor head protein [Clostridium novyi]|uniref:phage minor head protein n=1 Tax=Clostridium novyi TaxID=1542 RepID=UPI0004D49770|nr:phage minor head protein [Clostridium novyi]KEH89560.1 head protein [Clostridium novyi A str. 4540]